MTSNFLLGLPALAGVVLAWAIAWNASRRPRGAPGAFLAWLGIAVGWWCLGQFAWCFVEDAAGRLLLARLQYLGIVATPPLWLLVSLSVTGRTAWMTRGRAALLFVVPAVTLGLVFTNEHHGLIWEASEPVEGALRLRVTYGAWFDVHTAYSYSAVALGVILLAARFASSPFYRAQLGIVLLAPTGVLAGNLLHLVFRERLPIDPTPTAFALAFAAVAWALRRHRLLDLLPIARSLTVESLRDGVLVLDAAGRVVDSNPAARALFGPRASVVGTELGELLGREVPRSSPCELRLASGRRVELRLSPIAGAGGEIGGKVAELRDVTAEREAQDRLDEARRALELANAELERLANTDLLTGLANRRRFLARLEEELGRARRHQRPLALLLIDLDRFKEVNDRRGHPVGDKVLEAVGRSLVELLRPEDLAARYGGEELAVLLPETDLEGGRAVAERILGTLRALEHRDEGGETFIVTASLGVAALARLDEPARDLIARADAALYAAKDDGRDRVAVAAGSAAPPGS